MKCSAMYNVRNVPSRSWWTVPRAFCVGMALALPFVAVIHALGDEPTAHSEQGSFRYVIVYGDGTYSAYVYELDMLDAFNASNEPVLYAGPLNNDATMLWYFFRNARPRLTTCVVSAGAEG